MRRFRSSLLAAASAQLLVAPSVRVLVAASAALLPVTAVGAEETVQVPWRAGNATAFQTGAAEERHATAPQGSLPVTIYRPAGDGPFPFIVLLHGCGGLKHDAMWNLWVTRG